MNEQTKILLTGSSGMIGAALLRALATRRISAVKLVRHGARPETGEVHWSPSAKSPVTDLALLEGCRAAIHLSGANLASHRWTAAYRQEIVRSRVETTRVLAEALALLKNPPPVLLCASAVGIYGDRGEATLTEQSSTGSGFLAETCKAWEAAAQPAVAAGIRVAHMRFGVVLSADGGALAKVLPLFKAGLGGRLGNGRQWMSWITLRDLVRAALYVMDEEAISGPVNVTAPNPVTNAAYTQALSRTLQRPAVLPMPAFALRLALGEMADETVLASACVVPARLSAAGFLFQDAEIEPALRNLLGRA